MVLKLVINLEEEFQKKWALAITRARLLGNYKEIAILYETLPKDQHAPVTDLSSALVRRGKTPSTPSA